MIVSAKLCGLIACVAVALAMAAGLSAQSNPDPFIETARKAASQFIGTLPKYSVQRSTTRFEGVSRTCSKAQLRSDPDGCRTPAIQSWRTLNVVTADVATEKGKEVDLNLKLNGEPATENDVGMSGSWSAGDFAGTLQAILSLDSDARFTEKQQVTLDKQTAFRYDYSIDQPHSSWYLYAGISDYSPAYGGQIWFDQKTSRVLRVEMSARDLPDSFPLYKVEWSMEYDWVKIGDNSFLLPKHGETLNCQRDVSVCTRNATDFRDYREYTADSNITFGDTPK